MIENKQLQSVQPPSIASPNGLVPRLGVHGVPVIPVLTEVYWDIGRMIASKFPESGGVLGGPHGEFAVTRFHFDFGGSNTRSTYAPDVETLNALFGGAWERDNPPTDLLGAIHSHPPGTGHLSAPDLRYIARLLMINPHLGAFFAPLVLPDSQQLIPWVVYRDRPWEPVLGRIELI